MTAQAQREKTGTAGGGIQNYALFEISMQYIYSKSLQSACDADFIMIT
jgi:hypothetical protein